MRQWQIDCRVNIASERVIPGVTGNPYNFIQGPGVLAERKGAPDRVLVAKPELHKRFIDDRDHTSAGPVRRPERPACQDRDMHRLEKITLGLENQNAGIRVWLIRGSNYFQAAPSGLIAAQKRKLRHSGLGHARQSADPLRDSVIQTHQVLAPIPVQGSVHFEQQEIIGIEAIVDLLEVVQGAQEQAGSDEKDKRYRDLNQNKRTAKRCATTTGSLVGRAVFQRGRHLNSSSPQRGRYSKHKACRDRRAGRKQKDPTAQGQINLERISTPGCCQEQEPLGPISQNQPCGTAQYRQSQALSQQLANQPTPTRAQSDSNGYLFPACGGPSQQQVCRVGARNQQHKTDYDQQNVKLPGVVPSVGNKTLATRCGNEPRRVNGI